MRSAWASSVVKSSLPGRLWWARIASRVSDRSRTVARCSRIRASLRIRPVDGSIGELMSTRRRTVVPARSKSSRVKKSRPIGGANEEASIKASARRGFQGNTFLCGPRFGGGMPLRERDLAGPVVGHFEALGFTVFGEVGIALGPEEIVAVELKLRAWRDALRQATAYQLAADRAYVAMPLGRVQEVWGRRQAFEREGIGLLAVDSGTRVRDAMPASASPRLFPPLRAALRARLTAALEVHPLSCR